MKERTVTLVLTRRQASALHGLLLIYFMETRKPGADLPDTWVDVLDDSSISAGDLLALVSQVVMRDAID